MNTKADVHSGGVSTHRNDTTGDGDGANGLNDSPKSRGERTSNDTYGWSSQLEIDLPLNRQHTTVTNEGLRDAKHAESLVGEHNSMHTHRGLLRVLAQSFKSQRTIQRAWRLYNELREEDKKDVRLKTELLIWMSRSRSKIADAHCISLYWSIPVQVRTLAIYEAVLAAILRRKDYDFALSLQKEALANIGNGYSLSVTLFTHAVTRELWDLAVDVTNFHMEAFGNPSEMRFRELFWINVPDIPHLVRRSTNLVRWLLRSQQEGVDITKYQILASRIAHEALLQYLQHTYPSLPKESTIRDVGILIRYAHSSGKLSSKFYEDSLVRILSDDLVKSRKEHTRRLVSQLYLLYRQSHTPTEEILMDLLEYTASQAVRARELSNADSLLTLDEIVEDWKKIHGKLGVNAIHRLFSHYAYIGNVSKVQELHDYLAAEHDNPEDHEHALSALIYVHARRADLNAARQAFERAFRLAAKDGRQTDIRCWNNLLYAHARVDDVSGAILTMQRLLDQKEPKPTEVSFQPILQMLASRGDIDGIQKCFNTFDTVVAKQRPLAFTASMMNALVNIGEVNEASRELQQAITRVRDGSDRGSLTPHFNVLITAYALRRDVSMMMQTYRWMKKEGIWTNSLTYAALLQALVLTRQTEVAYRMLSSIMPSQDLDTTAFHYAIVMAGFQRQGLYDRALQVHKLMLKANIKDSVSSKRALVMAMTMLADRDTPRESPADEPVPLEEVQQAIQEAVNTYENETASPKEPLLGLARRDVNDGLSVYITPLAFVYGRRRCSEALRDFIYRNNIPSRQTEGTARTRPIGLLSAFMASHLNAGEFAEVEACWSLVMQQAEVEASLPVLPDFLPSGEEGLEAGTSKLSQELIDTTVAETGFDVKSRANELPKEEARVRSKQKATTKTRLSPTHRHILSSPLRIYLTALARQSRHVEAVNIVAKLLSQGWVLGNTTWNAFISMLCQSSPPLALSAFTFTERFLIPHFPGWTRSRRTNGSVREGLEHIRVRHLRRDQVMPLYRTMVHLGSALLHLRHREASGRDTAIDVPKEMARFVGDIRTIRERAPKTVFTIQSMPRVDDDLQNQLLHSDV